MHNIHKNAKKHIKNTVILNQCKSATNPVPTSDFHWLCMVKLLIFPYKKNIRLIKLSLSSLLTNLEAPSSVLKGIFRHFYP